MHQGGTGGPGGQLSRQRPSARAQLKVTLTQAVTIDVRNSHLSMDSNRDIERGGRDARLGRELVASDCHYFDAGARRYSAGAADLAHLPGFERIAAGVVVHRVRSADIVGEPALWVRRVEHGIARLGGALSRWYLDESDTELARVLAGLGYSARVELGLVLDADPHRAPSDQRVGLRAITTRAQWAAKLRIHQQSVAGIDDHATPEQWVAMERRKCAAGYMRPYLIESAGQVAGVVNVAVCGSILRMKNLVIAPAYRRQGVATSFAAGLAPLAAVMGCAVAGCFAIAGEKGERVYVGAGYRLVTRQVEWMKPLPRRGW